MDRIASGGMAEVYRALHVDELGREQLVALKLVLPHYNDDAEFLEMMRDEAKITRHLRHLNLARVLEFGEVDGKHYLAIEYIDGKDLRAIVKASRERQEYLPVEHVLFTMASALDGLHSAHIQTDERGRPLQVIHRDISPSNIIVPFAGPVKVIDFGIAKAAFSKTRTRIGIIKGKVRYMSPEQTEGKKLDPRSDVFSAGVVLYEALTLRVPFQAATENEMIDLIRNEEPVLPSQVDSAIPRQVDLVVMKALAKRRSARFQSAHEFAQALREVLRRSYAGYQPGWLGDYVAELFREARLQDEALLEEYREGGDVRLDSATHRLVLEEDMPARPGLLSRFWGWLTRRHPGLLPTEAGAPGGFPAPAPRARSAELPVYASTPQAEGPDDAVLPTRPPSAGAPDFAPSLQAAQEPPPASAPSLPLSPGPATSSPFVSAVGAPRETVAPADSPKIPVDDAACAALAGRGSSLAAPATSRPGLLVPLDLSRTGVGELPTVPLGVVLPPDEELEARHSGVIDPIGDQPTQLVGAPSPPELELRAGEDLAALPTEHLAAPLPPEPLLQAAEAFGTLPTQSVASPLPPELVDQERVAAPRAISRILVQGSSRVIVGGEAAHAKPPAGTPTPPRAGTPTPPRAGGTPTPPRAGGTPTPPRAGIPTPPRAGTPRPPRAGGTPATPRAGTPTPAPAEPPLSSVPDLGRLDAILAVLDRGCADGQRPKSPAQPDLPDGSKDHGDEEGATVLEAVLPDDGHG